MTGRLIHWSAATTSTNDQALAAIASGAPAHSVWLTDHQTQGRGRRTGSGSRRWFAPPGGAILMSLLLRPKLPPERAPTITLAAAVGCAESLSAASGESIGLKWPNDLLLSGRKVGGLLTEAAFTGDAVAVVIGMGINVNMSTGDFPADLVSQSTSLQIATGQIFDRLALIRAILDAVEAAVTELEANNGLLGDLRDRWQAHHVLRDAPVRILAPGPHRDATGHARDLTDEGALIVDLDSGHTISVHAGELAWL